MAICTCSTHPANRFASRRCLAVEQGDARPVTGGVADRRHPVQLAIRNQTEHHRVQRAQVGTEGSRQQHPIDVVDPQAAQQQAGPGVQRRLGQLDGAHVALGDDDVAAGGRGDGSHQNVFEGSAAPAQPRRGAGVVEQAVRAQQPRHAQLGDGLDDTAAADAGRSGGGQADPFAAEPVIAADHFPARLERRRIDADALDGSRRRPLAVGDLGALEGRAGGAGGAHDPLPVPDRDLGVGADVDDQADLVRLVRGFGQQHGDVVGADMAGDAGEQMHAGGRMQPQTDVGGAPVDRPADRQRERRPAQVGRVDAEGQVMHDRIADDHDVQHVFDGDPGRGARLFGQFVESSDDRPVHPFRALGLAHGVADPAHQVFAVAHLRVHRHLRRAQRPGAQITQMGHDRRRADVDRQPVGRLAIAGLGPQDLAVLPDVDRELSPFCAQGRRELRQQRGGERVDGQLPVLGQRMLQSLPGSRARLEGRGGDFEVVRPDRRLDVDGAFPGRLGDELLAGLALFRDHDQQIADDLRGARQPAPDDVVRFAIVGFDGADGREVVGARGDGMLGKGAFFDGDLTLAARLTPAADRTRARRRGTVPRPTGPFRAAPGPAVRRASR